MLWNHHRGYWIGEDQDMMPIGIFEHVRVEGDQLLGEARFHLEDERAVKIYQKVKAGVLRACSITIQVAATSKEPQYLVKGQTRPTVTKCHLLECSIVDIPSNGNAVRLSHSDDMAALDETSKLNQALPLLEEASNTNVKNKPMKEVAKYLNLQDNASEAEILAAVTNLANKADRIQAEFSAYKEKEQTAKCNALVEAAISAGKIEEAQRDTWLNMAKNGYEDAEKALGSIQARQPLHEVPQHQTTPQGGSTTAGLSADAAQYDKLKNDAAALSKWKQSNPAEYERCEAAFYEEI